jgi:hypothetical protein
MVTVEAPGLAAREFGTADTHGEAVGTGGGAPARPDGTRADQAREAGQAGRAHSPGRRSVRPAYGRRRDDPRRHPLPHRRRRGRRHRRGILRQRHGEAVGTGGGAPARPDGTRADQAREAGQAPFVLPTADDEMTLDGIRYRIAAVEADATGAYAVVRDSGPGDRGILRQRHGEAVGTGGGAPARPDGTRAASPRANSAPLTPSPPPSSPRPSTGSPAGFRRPDPEARRLDRHHRARRGGRDSGPGDRGILRQRHGEAVGIRYRIAAVEADATGAYAVVRGHAL